MATGSNTFDRIPLALAALLAAFVVVGLAASRFIPHRTEMDGTLPDLSSAQLVEIRDASGRTVLSGEFRERVDSLGNTKRDAALVDRRGRRIIGEVEINIPGPHGMSAGQMLEIDLIELKPNAKHALFIDDREIATFTTDDRGGVDMDVHSTPETAPAR